MRPARSLRQRIEDLAPIVAYFIALTANGAIRPAASYKALDLGANLFEVGVVGGAYGLLAMLVAVPVGLSIDRKGERPWIIGGLGAISLAAVIEMIAPSILVVAVGQAVLGLGQVCVAIALQARMAALPGPPGRDERFAQLSVATSLTQLVGPAMAGFIIGGSMTGPTRASGITAAFAVSAIAAALGMVLAVAAVRSVSHSPSLPARPGRSKARDLLGRDGVPASLMAGVTVATTVDLLVAYMPALGEEHGMSPAFIGSVLAVRGGASLASRIVLRPMLLRWGRRTLLAAMLLVSAASLVGIAVSGMAVAYVVLAVSLGFGLGVAGPITQAWTAEAAAADSRGSALALRISANRLSQLVIPFLLGGFAVSIGSGAVFALAATAMVAGSVLVRRAKFI